MDIAAFCRKVNEVDWHLYDGPKYYDANEVAPALIALATVDTIDTSRQISPDLPVIDLNAIITNNLMFAIGNDHCGSYYPAAFKAMEYIAEIALYGNTFVARNCAMNVLTDLYCFDYFDTGDPIGEVDREKKVQEMRAKISSYNGPLIEAAKTEGELNRALIFELIKMQTKE